MADCGQIRYLSIYLSIYSFLNALHSQLTVMVGGDQNRYLSIYISTYYLSVYLPPNAVHSDITVICWLWSKSLYIYLSPNGVHSDITVICWLLVQNIICPSIPRRYSLWYNRHLLTVGQKHYLSIPKGCSLWYNRHGRLSPNTFLCDIIVMVGYPQTPFSVI